MSKRQKKSLKELKTRARLALDSPALVGITSSANSPSQAYELAYLETGDVKASKACQYLATIKRDYGKAEFDSFVSSVVSDRPQPKAMGKSKGAANMRTETKVSENPTPEKDVAAESTKTPQLPLRRIEYRTVVSGLMAQVRCVQEYQNDAAHSVEAVYVFPLPEEASITGCVMQIGERKVEAVLKGRQEARQEYDEAVAAGHHGALLEQERPNIFTMNVGGIEPGEEITVQIDYVQRVMWQDSGGRFRVPLVVAPRFIPGTPTTENKGDGWSPDTDEVPDASRITPVVAKEGVSYTAEVNVSLSAGFRCSLTSPSHPSCLGNASVTVAKADTKEVRTGEIATDRDFILCYRSLSKVPEVALHCQQNADESFLLASVIPPFMAQPITADVVLLLDISGSMSGSKLAGLKVLTNKVLAKLKDRDASQQVAVIAFESHQHLIWPMGQITDELFGRIRQLDDRGGTELGPALTYAGQQFTDNGRPKFILLVTDGDTESLRYTMNGVRIIAAGIDTAVNDACLKSLARKTGGTCLWFYPGEDFDRAANSLFGYLSGPVLTDLAVTGGKVVGIQDVFQGQPATVAIRFQQTGILEAVLTGKDATGAKQEWHLKSSEACESTFAAQVWAREFLRGSHDQDEQVAVSLKYGVICQHTAFVAVSEKQVPGQPPVRVDIPVNLPHGWDYDKIFGQIDLSSLGGVSRGFLGPRYLCGGGDESDEYHLIASSSHGSSFMDSSPEPRLGLPPGRGPSSPLPRSPKIPSDAVPTPPIVASRFTLDAVDVVDRLIGILIAVDQGDFETAEKALEELQPTAATIKSWTEEKRSMAGYFLLRLKAYGLAVDGTVFAQWAATNATQASDWFCLIRKELGSPYNAQVSPNIDGYEYISWKLGTGGRPVVEPWSLVP